MKKFIKVLLALVLVFVLAAGSGIFYLTRGLSSGSKLEIGSVNLAALNDGVYDGKYKGGRWTNEINVSVKDHKITKIDLVKDVKISKPEVTSELFNEVVAKQNTNVDVIGGATVTSKAYLKSIENALSR